MGCLRSFLSYFSSDDSSNGPKEHWDLSRSRDSTSRIRKRRGSKRHTSRHGEQRNERGIHEGTIIRSSQDELEAMGRQILYHLQANHVEVHTINKPSELLRQLTGLVELRNNTLNDLQHVLQQRDADLFNLRGELNKRGQDIDRLGQEKGTLEAELRSVQQKHVETVSTMRREHQNQMENMEYNYTEQIDTLRATHDDYVNALRQDHHEQRTKMETSYQNQIAVMTANHDTFVRSEQQKHSEELEELSIQTKKRIDRVEQEMRMSVDNFQAKPDRTLVLSFENLKAAVQNLSRFRFDIATVQRDETFRARCSELRLPQQDYKFLLQSYLWGIVVDGIFESPFRVFGVYGDRLAETWALLFSHESSAAAGGRKQLPEPELSAEKWRYTTTGRLQRALEVKQPTRESDQQIVQSLQENASDLEQRISAWLAQMGARFEMTKVREIVQTASNFALVISAERCRVQLYNPSTDRDTNIGVEGTKDVNPGNGSAGPHRTPRFVVEPGLMKTGNARGGALHNREFLCRAGVYFGP